MPAAKTATTDTLPPAPEPEWKLAANVIQALARVQADIGGIEKKAPKGSTLKYPYRGIDAITSAAQPLFGRECIVISPTKVSVESVTDVTIGGNPWTSWLVEVQWTIYGPGGVDDCIHACTYGVGLDNSDKACNKATTQAYKQLILRLLSIGDPQDDADQPEHQDNVIGSRPPDPPISPEEQEAREIFDAIRELKVDDKAIFKKWVDDLPKPHPKVLVADMTADNGWRAKVGTAVLQLKMPVASPLGGPEEEPLDEEPAGFNYEGDG